MVLRYVASTLVISSFVVLLLLWQQVPKSGDASLVENKTMGAIPPSLRIRINHDIDLETEEETLGFEGMSKEERWKCMRDKMERPTGKLTSFNGQELPTAIAVDSLSHLKLKGGVCHQGGRGGCGPFHLRNYVTNEVKDEHCVREVPKLIHFVWLDKPLPQKYADNILQAMKVNSDWQFLLWVNEKSTDCSLLTNLLEAKKAERTWPPLHIKQLEEYADRFMNWEIIEKEPNVGARSDWIRLEAVYFYGGIYMDVDVKILHPFSQYGGIFRWPFVAYSDPNGYGNLCNCIFGAEKRSRMVKLNFEAWRDTFYYHRMGSGALGCPILTASFMTYNNHEILMLAEWYMFQKRDRIDPVLYMTFDRGWLPAPAPSENKEEEKVKKRRRR